MKQFKILTLSLLFILASTIVSSAFMDTPTDTVQAPPELTKEQIYSDVKSALSQLGGALKVGAEHVYEILVKQQLVNSITWTIVLVIGILYTIFSMKFALKRFNESDDDANEPLGIVLTISGFVTLICVIFCSFIKCNDIVTGYLNPEYGAIIEILDKVHG